MGWYGHPPDCRQCTNAANCSGHASAITSDAARVACLCIGCEPGYAGDLCEIDVDECASSPCQNGGICTTNMSAVNNFQCTCTVDYVGPTCSKKAVDLEADRVIINKITPKFDSGTNVVQNTTMSSTIIVVIVLAVLLVLALVGFAVMANSRRRLKQRKEVSH